MLTGLGEDGSLKRCIGADNSPAHGFVVLQIWCICDFGCAVWENSHFDLQALVNRVIHYLPSSRNFMWEIGHISFHETENSSRRIVVAQFHIQLGSLAMIHCHELRREL
jgi:hypothetical protein